MTYTCFKLDALTPSLWRTTELRLAEYIGEVTEAEALRAEEEKTR